jgi:hypothetical protein
MEAVGSSETLNNTSDITRRVNPEGLNIAVKTVNIVKENCLRMGDGRTGSGSCQMAILGISDDKPSSSAVVELV